MNTKNWKPVVGYEYRYLVSDCGNVWDMKHDREISQVITGIPEYLYVNLQAEEKRKLVRVHRLVAEAFCQMEEGKDVVDHIDQNKFNNHYSNLRWTCRKGNMRNTKVNRKTSTGELIVEVVEKKYGEVQPHLANIYSKMNSRLLSFEDAMFEYDYKRETGQEYSEWVSYIEQKYEAFGNKISMRELVEQYGHDKDVVKHKLQTGWSVEEVMSGCKWYDGKYAFLSTHLNCSGKWWPSKARCMEESGIGDVVWDKAVTATKEGLVDIMGAKKQIEDLNKKEWVVGDKTYFETFTGLCRLFGKDHSAVSTRMTRQGMSLEQALTDEPIRIKWYRLDGELILPSGEVVVFDKSKVKPIEITKLLAVNHGYFNIRNKKARDGCGIAAKALISTLSYFGCQVSNLSVTVEQQ